MREATLRKRLLLNPCYNKKRSRIILTTLMFMHNLLFCGWMGWESWGTSSILSSPSPSSPSSSLSKIGVRMDGRRGPWAAWEGLTCYTWNINASWKWHLSRSSGVLTLSKEGGCAKDSCCWDGVCCWVLMLLPTPVSILDWGVTGCPILRPLFDWLWGQSLEVVEVLCQPDLEGVTFRLPKLWSGTGYP